MSRVSPPHGGGDSADEAPELPERAGALPRSRRPRDLASAARATLWLFGALLFLAGACYGLRGPFVWGHYGYHAGEYSTRARHTLENGSLLPGNVPGVSAPRPGSYYLHHPILTHQLVTLTFSLLGDNEISLRLAALLSSAATVVLLSLFIRREHGPWWGAASLGLSALVPFNVWYAPHIDPGFPGIACLVAALLTYGTWLRKGRWRSAWWTGFWLCLAGTFDWTPFLFAVPFGLHVLVIAVRRRGRYLAFIPLFVVAVLLPAGIHALAVESAHQWDDLFGAYRQRAANMALGSFLDVMGQYGVELFGKPLLFAGALGFLLALVELFRGRGGVRPLAVVCFVVAMALHLAAFRIEVVTHAYRLIYLAPAVVLGAVGAAGWLTGLATRLPIPHVAAATSAFVMLALAGFTAPTSWRGALESRAHSGIPGWKTLDPSLPRPWLMRTLTAETSRDDVLYLHPSIPFRMELGFYVRRDFAVGGPASVKALPPAAQKHAVLAFVTAALPPQDWAVVAELAAHHPFRRLGPFGVIDLRHEGPRLESYALVPGVPEVRSRWQAYWGGPYVWPTLVPEPLTAARDAMSFGLPARAVGATPPVWPTPGLADPAALLEARNYHAMVGDAAARSAEEEALGRLFSAATEAPLPSPPPQPPPPVVAPPARPGLPAKADPRSSRPAAAKDGAATTTRAPVDAPTAGPADPRSGLTKPGMAPAAVAPPPPVPILTPLLVRRVAPTEVQLIGTVREEGGRFFPAVRVAGTSKAVPISVPWTGPLGRHRGQWVLERIAVPPDLARAPLRLDLYDAPSGSTPWRPPFASVVIPAS